jgi:hypothetical protein
MPPSKAKAAETAARRAKLIRMRREGHDFDHIAEVLDYASRGAATKDLLRALKQNSDEEAAEVAVYRQQENERLDALLRATWSRATEPSPVLDKEGNVVAHELDMRAVDTVLRLMDRRAKLNGLDMPTKAELSGPDGGIIPLGGTLAELNGLITTAGEHGPASEFELPAADGREDVDESRDV